MCSWLTMSQKQNIANCIKILNNICKNRRMELPAEIENAIAMVTYGVHKNNVINKKMHKDSCKLKIAKDKAVLDQKKQQQQQDQDDEQSDTKKPDIRTLPNNYSTTTINYSETESSKSISENNDSSAESSSLQNNDDSIQNDKSIVEKLQEIVSLIEIQFRPLIQAELSVLVDIFFKPELLFPERSEARKRCSNGGFIRKLISQTENFLDEQDDKLCVRILETLKEMMTVDPIFEKKAEDLRKASLERFLFNKKQSDQRDDNNENSKLNQLKKPLNNYLSNQNDHQLTSNNNAESQQASGDVFIKRAGMKLSKVQCELDAQVIKIYFLFLSLY